VRTEEPTWQFDLNDGRVTHAQLLASDEDVERLQRLLELLPSYCENTIGYPPGPAEAHSTLIARPPSSAPDDKVPLGVFDTSGQLIAFLDLILRFPEQGQCYIGYVLVDPQCQHQGLGSYLLKFATRLATSWQSHCTRATTGLIETFGPQGQSFLEQNGFTSTGRATPYEVNTISSVRFEYVKVL
jgi:GNAT superfamily N-acetyltransferase